MLKRVWSVGAEGVFRKIATWIVGGAILLVILGAVIFLVWIFPDAKSWLYDDKGEIDYWRPVSLAWAWIHDNWRGFADALIDDPWQVVRLLSPYFVLFVSLVLSVILYRRLLAILMRYERGTRLLQNVGLFAYWPTADMTQRDEEWQALATEILHPDNRFLFILGASGWETFGHEATPLFKAVADFRGSTRIILMDSESPHVDGRAASAGKTPATFRNQIRNSIARLRELRERGRHIELCTYDSPPNWKLIITSTRAWVQYYRSNSHVANTPVYRFYSTDPQNGLYHAFYDEFHRIWGRCAPKNIAPDAGAPRVRPAAGPATGLEGAPQTP